MATERKSSFDYANEIWNIADYVRDVINRKDYNKLVLPFALLRRLECALEPTRDTVFKALEENEAKWGRDNDSYCQYSGKPFYNLSKFRLNNLGSDDTLEALKSYISSFSLNAREILEKFGLEEICKKLNDRGMLYEVCKKFAAFDFGSDNISDREMSDIYEHLIERFGEAIAEDAEDFMTPRDIVRLAVNIIFAEDKELLGSEEGVVRTLYDPTMGTGGFITDALDLLDEWSKEKKMVAPAVIVPYGQECENESWAMGKSNLLIRNIANADKDEYDATKDLSAHIVLDDTLTDDAFSDDKFDYILSNPPYGKKWEKQQASVLEEAKLGFAGRFGAGLPSINDGSMLFLQHVVSKMKDPAEGKSKVGIVLSASPLFVGCAGSGPSNVRRWLFEKDYIDCIVKLPSETFFRTGISTYLWVLTNQKPKNRQGMIQLIDASALKTKLQKSQGNKRYKISEDDIAWIVKTYLDGHDHGNSVLVPYTDFMYRQVTTRRPLRMRIHVTDEGIEKLMSVSEVIKLTEGNKDILIHDVSKHIGLEMPYSWAGEFAKNVRISMDKPNVQSAQLKKAIIDCMGIKDSNYEPAINKNGSIVVDSDLNDTEDVPLGQDFDTYMKAEVLPFAPDAYIDETVIDKGSLADGKVGVVGTNISFNKYFYHYEEPRNPKEIASEILNLESGLEAFMEDFLK